MHDTPVYLTSEQIDKLRRVLTPTIPIYPSPVSSSFPTLHITPKDFLRKVLTKLKQHSIHISAIRLHGGAASYVLINDSDFVYRDIDILFLIKTPLSSQQQTTLFSSNNEPYLCDVWTIIKYIISSCLIEYIPNPVTCTQYFVASVLDTYTKKNIKISSEQDSWALLSLQNLLGQNLELKFVENLKRQWQFSVDSFQINLKPLLFESTNQQSITTKIQTKSLIVNAINGVNIIKKDDDNDTPSQSTTSTSPLQFGSFTPSLLPYMTESDNQYQTLATITTIETSNDSESRLHKSESTINEDDEHDHANSPLQFQLSINEDVDDGIEVDADESNNEDDGENCSESLTRVYSVYRDLHQALHHLNNKLIATYEPETMRGGGLLKYCDLLARNYKLYDTGIMVHMQRYMCSRFCIDYKSIPEQIHVIVQYVATHFLPSSDIHHFHISTNLNENFPRQYFPANQLLDSKYDSKQIDQIDLINARLCLLFFEHLAGVVHHSTVCLTHEDRELLLINIHYLKEFYHHKYEYLFCGDPQHQQKYHGIYHHQHHHCTNSSSNSSRSSSPSNMSTKSYGYKHGHSQRNHQRQSTYPKYPRPHHAHPQHNSVHCRNQS